MGLVKREEKIKIENSIDEEGYIWVLLDDGDGTDEEEDGYFIEIIDEECSLMSFRVPYKHRNVAYELFDYISDEVKYICDMYYSEDFVDVLYSKNKEFECKRDKLINDEIKILKNA